MCAEWDTNLADEITRMVEEIRSLGPLNWPAHSWVGSLLEIEESAGDESAREEPILEEAPV